MPQLFSLPQLLAAQGFELLSVEIRHGLRAGGYLQAHRDPFDRMMIAQAIEEGLTIVTRDRQFEAYGVPLLKA